MQIIASDKFYFIKSVKSILKVSRQDASFSVIQHIEFASEQSSLHAIGEIDAVLGKLKIEDRDFLLVVVNSTQIASRFRKQSEIRRIDRVVAIFLDPNERIDPNQFQESNHLTKFKNSHKKFIKLVSGKSGFVQPRLVNDILRLFNDNGDFYFETNNEDLTRNLQNASTSKETNPDERFFWNKQMLVDLINIPDSIDWIVPVIQGYVGQKNMVIDSEDVSSTKLTITLISRRSTERAGTRYLRRGIDENGNVANFVETELIIDVFGHQLAFVQIRGSVPLFWSQKGYRYRPPLIIDKEMKDSFPVFEKHIQKLLDDYGKPLIAVNLVNQTGRELCLAQSFLEHILKLNSENLGYFSFDFHFHCRALKFHKVNDLISSMKTKLAEIGYCWMDKSGEIVLKQNGIIRTNCVDCLDRTNVVQNSICQFVAMTQFRRLGFISPMTDEFPEVLLMALQEIWADNGDAISRQYAGTDALKGDVTRSGQRKITGLVKDGYNSASRYYLSHMKDAQRQKAIDAVLFGGSTTETEIPDETADDEDESENIGRLVNETVRFVLPDGEVAVGSWALVDGDNQNDLVDSILLLTRSHIYIAQYEEETDKLTGVTTISFNQILKMEVGFLGKNPRKHLRIYWASENGIGVLFDTWRAAKTRLFNNVAISLKDGDEADEYVQAICEQLRITISMCSNKEVSVIFTDKLQGGASTDSRAGFSGIFRSVAMKMKKPAPTTKPTIKIDSTPDENQKMSIPASYSDSQISGLQSLPNSNSFVSKLSAKLKGPIWKNSAPDVSEATSLAEAVRVDPFQEYKEQILASKSLIQML